ncbi:hypothetical protein [Moritella dasanensis]|uniref:hypothetical protein n=1 Tax=Moritella dasanensis TaxID=428031 RepID=UPI001ED9504D|nr:hypothetical protein [Moritella dasanensis]
MKFFKYHFLTLLVTLLVAGSFVSSAKLSGIINPFSLTLLRFVIAAGLLLLLVYSCHSFFSIKNIGMG